MLKERRILKWNAWRRNVLAGIQCISNNSCKAKQDNGGNETGEILYALLWGVAHISDFFFWSKNIGWMCVMDYYQSNPKTVGWVTIADSSFCEPWKRSFLFRDNCFRSSVFFFQLLMYKGIQIGCLQSAKSSQIKTKTNIIVLDCACAHSHLKLSLWISNKSINQARIKLARILQRLLLELQCAFKNFRAIKKHLETVVQGRHTFCSAK